MTEIYKGVTDQSVFIELVDSTTGLPKTAIVYTDVTGSYVRTRSARVAISTATLASASAAHSDGGFILVDDTNQPGVYRFDIPDAAFATGVDSVVVTVKATGCRTVSRLFDLVNINNQIAYVDSNVIQISGDSTAADNAESFFDGTGYAGTNNVIPTVTTTTTATNVTTVNGLAANVITAASIATDAVTEIQSGLATAANLSTVAGYLDTEIAAILEDTGTTLPAQIAALNNLSSAQVVSALGTGSWATSIPWNASWDTEVQSEVADALAVYDPPTNAEMEARTIVAASYATATELALVIKTGEAITHVRSGKSNVIETITRN